MQRVAPSRVQSVIHSLPVNLWLLRPLVDAFDRLVDRLVEFFGEGVQPSVALPVVRDAEVALKLLNQGPVFQRLGPAERVSPVANRVVISANAEGEITAPLMRLQGQALVPTQVDRPLIVLRGLMEACEIFQ